MPYKGTGIWQMNLEQLSQRLGLFNGRRVIAVVRGPNCDPPEAVQDFLQAHPRLEWVVVDNNAQLREVATHHLLWERVRTDEDWHCTFYAHAKGVTRPVNPGVTVHPWTRLLYHTNLDYWPLVATILENNPLAGSLKKVGHGFRGSASTFHFSGNFYWARNKDVFTRDWRRIDQTWWGTESWVGTHFRPDEAGCIFLEGVVPSLNLYSMDYLRGTALPELERWETTNRKHFATFSPDGTMSRPEHGGPNLPAPEVAPPIRRDIMTITGSQEPFQHWILQDLFPAEDVAGVYQEAVGLPDGDHWARYTNDCEAGKRACRSLSKLGAATNRLFDWLLSPRFVKMVEEWTGVGSLQADPTLHGAGIHVTDPGGWLNTHLDYELHPTLGLERRVNLVLFLNPEWREDWGGAFLLCDPTGSVQKKVLPNAGRALLWESSNLTYHGVEKTAPDAPPRVTVACYYLAPPRPGASRKRALFIPHRP